MYISAQEAVFMPQSTKRLLVIGFVWPEPQSSAAGRRMMQLLQFFADNNWQITFASTAKKTKYTEDLESIGIETTEIRVNHQSFDHFIKELSPDAVMFDRFMTEEQFGWRVQTTCPEAIRILDTEDLHSLRYARQKSRQEGVSLNEAYVKSDIAKREIASIYRSDLSLIISEPEIDYLTTQFKIDDSILHYLPYMIEAHPDKLPAFENRKNFVTIGNFRHKPNLDSVEFLKNEIWPKISAELPEAEMHVYGAYPTQQVKEWNKPSERFFVKGRAESAQNVISNARVCLAPLRFGAGLKGKLTESMQYGLPSVTTTIGAEGINGKLPWPGDIADDATEFAKAAVDLYQNREKWLMAQEAGYRIIKERFYPKVHRADFKKRLEVLSRGLTAHRNNNFIGAMLSHHTMASTRFMSRWIEEKNRGD